MDSRPQDEYEQSESAGVICSCFEYTVGVDIGKPCKRKVLPGILSTMKPQIRSSICTSTPIHPLPFIRPFQIPRVQFLLSWRPNASFTSYP